MYVIPFFIFVHVDRTILARALQADSDGTTLRQGMISFEIDSVRIASECDIVIVPCVS